MPSFNFKVVSLFIALIFTQSAFGAGKKPSPTDPVGPVFSTPSPLRKVILKPVKTKPFFLPNGVRVDLQQELDAIFLTSLSEASSFAATEVSVEDPCETTIEIRPEVSTVQMDVSELNLTFGYSPAGPWVPGQSATAEFDVKVGLIAMEMSIWECSKRDCHLVYATSANQSTANSTGKIRLNFGTIRAGVDFSHHPVVQEVFRKIALDGISRLASTPRLSELSWRATVREYHPDSGILIFDQGVQSRLRPNQTFVVYAVTPETGVCDVYKPVANIHSTEVDTISTQAIIDQIRDLRGIEVGDQVMIKNVNPLN